MDAFQALLNAAAEMPQMEAETTSNNSLDNNNNNCNGHPQAHADNTGTTSTAPKRLPIRKRVLYDMLSEDTAAGIPLPSTSSSRGESIAVSSAFSSNYNNSTPVTASSSLLTSQPQDNATNLILLELERRRQASLVGTNSNSNPLQQTLSSLLCNGNNFTAHHQNVAAAQRPASADGLNQYLLSNPSNVVAMAAALQNNNGGGIQQLQQQQYIQQHISNINQYPLTSMPAVPALSSSTAASAELIANALQERAVAEQAVQAQLEIDFRKQIQQSYKNEQQLLLQQRMYQDMLSNAIANNCNNSSAAAAIAMNNSIYSEMVASKEEVKEMNNNNPYRVHPLPPDNQEIGKLYLPSDPKFISEAHCFLRSVCIELFVATEQHVTAPGKGARPSHVGQVGFRCIHCKNIPRYHQANQATCFPSKCENIFESIRNFQRVHFNACIYTPEEVKTKYKTIVKRGKGPKRSHKLVRAYYTQAGSELGLVDTMHGLEYREDQRREGGEPSKEMLCILQAAKAEEEMLANGGTIGKCSLPSSPSCCSNVASLLSSSGNNPSKKNITTTEGTDEENLKYGKFDSICSAETERVLSEAKQATTPFVIPEDSPTISDFVYLLFHQLLPCKHTPATIKRRRLDPVKYKDMPGLCCKHCHDVDGINGMYFPASVDSLGDSSFSQTLMLHISTCSHVPIEIKSSLEELKALVKEYKSSVKRGAKKKFIEKVWRRMEELRIRSMMAEEHEGLLY